MMEEQDPNVPSELVSSVYACFVSGMDIYEMYGAMAIPYKYGDAIDAYWESWEEADKKNPPDPGVARMIPYEWPGLDDDDDEEKDVTETNQNDEHEVLLDKFRRRFGNLYELYDKGTADEVTLEIESIFRDFRNEHSIREDFNGFLKSASTFLNSKGRRDVLALILQDIEIPKYLRNILSEGVTPENELIMIKLSNGYKRSEILDKNLKDTDDGKN